MAEWITTKQAARVSGYHPDTIRELVRMGKVKGQKFGEVWQIDRRSLLAYVKAAEKLGARRGPKPKA
jgi:excisionase family DNA binding protein